MITAVPVDFPDSALEAELLDGLAQVEESLAATAHPDDELLTEASRHLIEAGGKRFRAMLVLLAAQFGDPRDPRVVRAAVAIELTHLATLFHDDVMDEALVRRGHPSVNSRWNNSVAILTGDFLFAQASQMLAGLGPEAVRIQAETFTRLVTGQMAETVGIRPGQDPLDFYMHVIREKTGSLISTSGRFGALFSGAPAEVASRIAAACEQIGVAWQLSDDVIDIASDSSQSGKTPGTDLRQGVRTLPVLYALRSVDKSGPVQSPADTRLRWLLGEADLTDEALLAEALTLLRGHHAMKESRADVLNWVHEARVSIRTLPDVPARAAFLALCDFVEKRTGLPPGHARLPTMTGAWPHDSGPPAGAARTRDTILRAAASLATVRGLDGLTIGNVAAAVGMSRSDLRAYYGSKGELQLAIVAEAARVFDTEVMQQALAAPAGLGQLAAVCEAFFAHLERRTFPGGCFVASAALEMSSWPEPVRDLVAAYQAQFGELIRGFAFAAVAGNELPPGENPDRLAFELNGIMLATDTNYVLHDDPAVLDLARQIVRQRLGTGDTQE